MNHQVLARKWRPHNFTEIVGQEHISQALINALQHDRGIVVLKIFAVNCFCQDSGDRGFAYTARAGK
jgi:hypothetical protein